MTNYFSIFDTKAVVEVEDSVRKAMPFSKNILRFLAMVGFTASRISELSGGDIDEVDIPLIEEESRRRGFFAETKNISGTHVLFLLPETSSFLPFFKEIIGKAVLQPQSKPSPISRYVQDFHLWMERQNPKNSPTTVRIARQRAEHWIKNLELRNVSDLENVDPVFATKMIKILKPNPKTQGAELNALRYFARYLLAEGHISDCEITRMAIHREE